MRPKDDRSGTAAQLDCALLTSWDDRLGCIGTTMTAAPSGIEYPDISRLDAEHVWHPYGGFPASTAPLIVVSAEGVRLRLSDGRELVVEVAVKMCIQYWRARGRTRKTRLMTWRGGYHGDTVTPMSICDPDGGIHSLWTGVLPQQIFSPAPPREFDASAVAEFEEILTRHRDEVAAIVVEPIVQGAGGMRFHDARYLTELRRMADENGVLLVFGEIATGFGRTGKLFAADYAGVTPDVMCVGKALTGGYMTLAATLCTAELASVISGGEGGGLMHGPTFMGNPLACAVAFASVELLLVRNWEGEVAALETGLLDGLAGVEALPGVADVRVLGGIGVVEMHEPVDMQRATDAAVRNGVWLRPFGKLVYAMPPYVCTAGDVAAICGAMRAVASSTGL